MSSRTGDASDPTNFESLEIWGGVECTCNRVQDRYFDQMMFSGHDKRLSDYELFAEIGFRTLRVGALWEHYERDRSWCWADDRLLMLKQLGIRPIVGLIHHGSGPRHTSLHDPAFPEKLASYARQLAERYPWIDCYTPVNEPNTTARFSCMYGIWYPHTMSRTDYLRALLNQLKATVLSMEAIRLVRPDARLIQTEDVGNISGTEELRPVWELLNLRQWLPFDLLCGRVDRGHPLFGYMRAAGISGREIDWFSEHRCPPDILGINYYVTSDRFLDHRLEFYPANRRSAEGAFVDVEAARVRPEGIVGFDALIRQAWEQYGIPVAVTEAHLGCTVDEQIRWFLEAWRAAMQARREGVQCVAITAWALLGSFYWDQLVTSENGYYEPGLFDVRSGLPEPTELAGVVSQIASGEDVFHPAQCRAGWWREQSRMCFSIGEEVAA